MSLFSILGVATKGMAAAQVGMDISGQNISNADVPGYSQKRLNLTPDYVSDGTFGEVGFGVDVVNIQRQRSSLLDQQIQSQNQQVGYYTEQNDTMTNIQNVFTEPSDTGIQTYMNQFFDSWQNLANNPSDLSARTTVKTDGQILCDTFHNLSTQLTNLRQTKNDEISSYVDQVNKLTKDIFNMNKEIATVELSGQNANDSRDKRDQDLKDLSKLIDIDSTEDKNGEITVTTDGNIIVSPAYQQDIETSSSTKQLADGTTISDTSLRFADSKLPYTPQDGQIKSLFDSRDTVIPQYQKQLDTLANTLVSTVNKQHELGYTANGYSGADFFDPSVTGASDINISAAINSDVQNIAAGSGGQIVAYTEPGTTSLVFGNPATALTNKNILYNSVSVMAGTTALTEGTDYSIDYRSGTIQLLHNGYNNTPLSINYKYTNNGSKGVGDNSNAIAIAQLREQPTLNNDVLGNPTSTYTDYYSSFVGKLGLSVNQASSNLDSRNFLVQQYQTQQDTIAGVSIDDEMTNIIKFQHIYAASARIVTTTSEMLDKLLSM